MTTVTTVTTMTTMTAVTTVTRVTTVTKVTTVTTVTTVRTVTTVTTVPLRNEFPAFFLGIPRNSQKFPTIQISLHQISLEFLRIFGNGKLGLTLGLGLEFLGIPRNSKFYNFRSLRIVENFGE